ncbi:MAG: peptide chain release factor N(5)-glutamine methyltransferase [Planctomycetota bacterium]|nr:peptide chain release factor N(5)-glutamine methyltransferase [Planctomycetota bacterium]
MSQAEPWTTKRLLEWTTDYLKQNGSDSPRLDAEVLLAEARGCQRIELYTAFDQVTPDEQLATFRGWIRERAAGKPVAYLVGHREFYSLPFSVNEHVLIPRPETELLVTLAIDCLSRSSAELPTVCDVGTGSGCIPVAIARNHPTCSLTAIDLCGEALQVARQNAEEHQVSDRIEFLQGDLLAPLTSQPPFDLVVSNPPYIGLGEKEGLASEVRDHEPHLALFAGKVGTEIIQRLVDQATRWLKPGGTLMFETSPLVIDQCVELVERNPGFEGIQIQSDLSKQPRVVAAEKTA